MEKLTQEGIAQITGVSRSSVNGWLSGEAKTIRASNWVRLYPHLRGYLQLEELDDIDLTLLPPELITMEKFRRRIQNTIMDSDLDDGIKVKVFGIIRSVSLPPKIK